jgi:ribonuclease E
MVDDEQPTTEAAEATPTAVPRKRTAKKTTSTAAAGTAPRKRAAKKTGSTEPTDPAEPAAAGDTPPRKRTRKKAAPAESGSASAESAVPGVIFQPPAATTPARKRAAKKTAAAPAPEPGDSAEPQGAAAVAGSDQSEDGADEPGGDRPARRRRGRRGGRGRGGGGGGASAGAADAAAETDQPTAPGESADTELADTEPDEDGGDGAGEGEGDGTSASSRRRRRRRRRRTGEGADGEATEGEEAGDGDAVETVVHVREPRPRKKAAPSRPDDDDGVRGVKGSTRLEAKRQRRRDGRDTGRRRTPVITESEFLARRESVERVMVVRQTEERTQIGVLEDGVLVEHYVARKDQTSMVGNVFLGKVQNVLPSMEAAFVDIGRGRNAVLYAGEVNYDASVLEGRPPRIEQALKGGQSVLVQVTKDPIGHKGSRLTSQVSLPGRYMVYVPDGRLSGISRKLPDTERSRLKGILKRLTPEDAGVIIRTAAEGASEEDLERDLNRLHAQWLDIEKKAQTAAAPALIYSEPDVVIRVIRDIFNEDFKELIVQGDDEWETVDNYVRWVAPDLADRTRKWDGDEDVFAAYRIDEQLAKALDRKVHLPSGGSLVIDRTEAMVVVDVNTGKFTGKGGNLEETVTKNNIEAAEEIVRQLRLRDLGGIIVIDFIDMVLESNRDLVLRRLMECLGRDRTRHQVAEVTSLGLVQMTRKRVGQGLLEAFSEVCKECNGRGVIITHDPVESKRPAKKRRRGGGKGSGAAAEPAAPAEPAPAEAPAEPAPAELAEVAPA